MKAKHDPCCPIQIELAICFPYDDLFKKKLLLLIEALYLTKIQGVKFIGEIYYTLQIEYGQYATQLEFDLICEKYFIRFERRLGKLDAPSLALVGRSGVRPLSDELSARALIPFIEDNKPLATVTQICHRIEAPFPVPFDVMKAVKFRFQGDDIKELIFLLNSIKANKNVKLNLVDSVFYAVEESNSFGQKLNIKDAFNLQCKKIIGWN